MFFNPFINAFGLDIGDLSLKAVQLTRSRFGRGHNHFVPTIYRSIHLPHGLIANGELQEPEPIRRALEHILRPGKHGQKSITSQWVVASLPDSQGFLKLIHLDKLADAITEEDVLFAAKKHIPLDEEEYYTAWQVMPGSIDGDLTPVMIGAIPKKTADMYTYLLESVGLVVLALELESLATARSMITANKTYDDEARAILDIGATRSSLIIYDHGYIQLSITLPYSGELLTTAISQKLHCSYEDAEREKRRSGFGLQSPHALPLLDKLTDDLVMSIQKGLSFYYSHFPKPHKITHITMCGGGAALKRLDKILAYKLKISARPGRVWKNLLTTTPAAATEKESLEYATAIGLALRAADNPFFTHHLL